MLTLNNCRIVQANVQSNFQRYLPSMIKFKSEIQTDVDLTELETLDLIACRLNMNVVRKLTALGRAHFASSDRSDEILYCICMAVGTIIKEYDWGTYYISPEGICELANMIGG